MIPEPKFGNLRSPQSDLLSGKSTFEPVATSRLEANGGRPVEFKRGSETAGSSGSKTGRISALDFTKGTLVLVMVLYHWLNYFVGSQGSFYRYLSFLPPSFICI